MISLKGLLACLFLFCFQSAQGKCARLNKKDEFIVGGQPAPRPIPFQVFIDVGYRPESCGGVIISPQHVLTITVCIREPSRTTVRAGTIHAHSGGSLYKVAWGKKHHKHVSHGPHDIGIIKIQETFVWSNDVQPIAFNSTKLYPGGQIVWVSGWGCTDQNGTIFSDTLQQVAQRTMSHKSCKRILPGLDDRQICAFARYGVGCCTADYGGPLVNAKKNMLIGIFSLRVWNGNVSECAVGRPDIYTRVSSYVDWIENIMYNCL